MYNPVDIQRIDRQIEDLQRIKAAENKEKEVEYQIKATKAKLEAMGIVTEDLNI